LSLQQNNITRWSDLEPWSHATKFSQLETLLLIDNPIQRNARDPTEYQNEISRRFPSLKWLDGNAIVKIVFDIPTDSSTRSSADIKVELPGKIQQSAWAEGSKDIGVGFLSVFFSLYDNDRQNLAQQYYTPTSLFSLSVDTTTPHQPTHQRRNVFPGPSQSSNMGSYIPQSRNLQRMTNPNTRRTRLHHGRDQIAQAFNNLPRTRHPIEDAAAFVADGFQVQISSAAGIMVSVHGEFLEVTERGTEVRRSFDRTFLLGPPVPTNPGSHCVVVSDLLVLRPWSGRDAWVPEPGVDAQGLAQEVRRRTGLNEQYSEMLLRECNGDVEAAVRRFEEAKVICP
jgi:nuclear RNA export factor